MANGPDEVTPPYGTPDKLSHLRRWLPEDPTAPILDWGFGGGWVLDWLADSGYTSLLGVDTDRAAADLLKARLPHAVVECEHGSDWLERHPGSCQTIISRDSVYYIPWPDVPHVLRAFYDALRPGGRLLLELFNGAAWTGGYLRAKDPAIQWVPTDRSVRRALVAAGFTSVTVWPVRIPPTTWRRRAHAAAGMLWTLILRSIFLIERGRGPEEPKIWTPRFLVVAERPRDAAIQH
jgi:SAM-dependent methyltransferase